MGVRDDVGNPAAKLASEFDHGVREILRMLCEEDVRRVRTATSSSEGGQLPFYKPGGPFLQGSDRIRLVEDGGRWRRK